MNLCSRIASAPTSRREFLAQSGGKLFGIVHALERFRQPVAKPFLREDDSRSDDRSGQRAATRLVDAGDRESPVGQELAFEAQHVHDGVGVAVGRFFHAVDQACPGTAAKASAILAESCRSPVERKRSMAPKSHDVAENET